jgi:hypothetical protein
MSALAVEAQCLVKTFGSTPALDGIDLQIPQDPVQARSSRCAGR